MYRIVIGNKNISSWSLRPWLVLRHFELSFRGEHLRPRQDDSCAQIVAHAPNGQVPILKHGEAVIWESLAIIEYLAERHPECAIWPAAGAAAETTPIG